MLFANAFYGSTLPPELLEAVASNLTILKSTTVLRDRTGRLWGWEGSSDEWGACYGSNTHVWNYAQAFPHLFPSLERTLRETEFRVSQNEEGAQAFRTNLPISPPRYYAAASDGQLGGIMKVYREWRICGDHYILLLKKAWTTVLKPGIPSIRDIWKNPTTIHMISITGVRTVCAPVITWEPLQP